ncbi:DUF3515 domain-containing protein, partial [Nocardioides sp.]|uniref:DUF3515 domain-containing protein n=1 Tax=Nocardioides sp. TaxID=35761 RepID=UPI0031FF0B25|nr:hypothetical protein [Nocardioides sp.]
VACGKDDGPVRIESPHVSGQVAHTCRGLLDDLPDTLADEVARPVSPGGALGAAWGDPAITLTCGVSIPDDYDQYAFCEETNGVGWFIPDAQLDDESSDVTFTTVGYRPIIEVRLPATYRPDGAAAVPAQLADAVKANLRLVKRCL